MNILKNWLVGTIVACALLSVCYAVLPKGKFRTIARCSGGVILLLVLLQPLVQADWSEVMPSYESWEAQLNLENEKYAAEQNAELTALIAEKTAAYIEKKAASLGVVCHAQIDCEERDGVPFPTAVTMDIPYDKRIAELICEELDIQAESQYWQEVAA